MPKHPSDQSCAAGTWLDYDLFEWAGIEFGLDAQFDTRPNCATSVPSYLLELPETVVAPPPVEPRIAKLPFDELSWQDFERVVFRLASKNPDVEYCAP